MKISRNFWRMSWNISVKILCNFQGNKKKLKGNCRVNIKLFLINFTKILTNFRRHFENL